MTHLKKVTTDLQKYKLLERYEKKEDSQTRMHIFLKATARGKRYVDLFEKLLDSVGGYEGFAK